MQKSVVSRAARLRKLFFSMLYISNSEAFTNVDWIGAGSFAVAFYVLRRYKWNPILTMCLCGAAGLVLRLVF